MRRLSVVLITLMLLAAGGSYVVAQSATPFTQQRAVVLQVGVSVTGFAQTPSGNFAVLEVVGKPDVTMPYDALIGQPGSSAYGNCVLQLRNEFDTVLKNIFIGTHGLSDTCDMMTVMPDGNVAIRLQAYNNGSAVDIPVTDNAVVKTFPASTYGGYQALLVIDPVRGLLKYGTFLDSSENTYIQPTSITQNGGRLYVSYNKSNPWPNQNRLNYLLSIDPSAPSSLLWKRAIDGYVSDTIVANGNIYLTGGAEEVTTTGVVSSTLVTTPDAFHRTWDCASDGSDPNFPPMVEIDPGIISYCSQGFLKILSLDGTERFSSYLPRAGFIHWGDQIFSLGSGDIVVTAGTYDNVDRYRFATEVLQVSPDGVLKSDITIHNQGDGKSRTYFDISQTSSGELFGLVNISNGSCFDPYGFGCGTTVYVQQEGLVRLTADLMPENEQLFSPNEANGETADLTIIGNDGYVWGDSYTASFPAQHEVITDPAGYNIWPNGFWAKYVLSTNPVPRISATCNSRGLTATCNISDNQLAQATGQFSITWGDGSTNTVGLGAVEHTYVQPGEYPISIIWSGKTLWAANLIVRDQHFLPLVSR